MSSRAGKEKSLHKYSTLFFILLKITSFDLGNEKVVDFWSEIIATDDQHEQQQSAAVVYRRKNPQIESMSVSHFQ